MFSAKQVTTLINDLLDLAKMEKRQFTFNNEFFNLRETIMQGIQQIEYMATQKSVHIKCVFNDLTKDSLRLKESGERSHVDLQILNNVFGDPRRFV